MKNTIACLKEMFPAETHCRIFLVGGAVRDILLGRERTDIDLAAALSPAEFTALGFRLVEGKSTSAIWFRHDAQIGAIEVTPLRNCAALNDDLQRRDFCCNALAMSLAGVVLDPLAGRPDLDHRLLRACSSQTFVDDPLRIFRAFRFAADGWSMSAVTEGLIRQRDWNRESASIPVERFSREMLKALGLRKPERFFQLMLEFGAGQGWLPELFRMPHIPAGPPEHHPEGDLFTHSVQVLQRVTAMTTDSLTRFCAFFHDIGKLATAPDLYPRHHGHDQAGFAMAIDLCRRLRLPADYGTALAWVSRLHGTFNLWDNLRDSTRIRSAEQAIKAGIADILPLVAAADKAGGREPEEWRVTLELTGLSADNLGIDLQQLEGMQPSKRRDYILQKRVEHFRATRTSSI